MTFESRTGWFHDLLSRLFLYDLSCGPHLGGVGGVLLKMVGFLLDCILLYPAVILMYPACILQNTVFCTYPVYSQLNSSGDIHRREMVEWWSRWQITCALPRSSS